MAISDYEKIAGDYDRLFENKYDNAEWEAVGRLLKMHYTTGIMLDLGCGTGTLLRYFNPDRYIGVDNSPGMIKRAREKFPQHDFFVHDIEKRFELPDNSIGCAVSLFGVFNHLRNPFGTLVEVKRVLKPSSKIIIMALREKDEAITPIETVYDSHRMSRVLRGFFRHEIFGFYKRRNALDKPTKDQIWTDMLKEGYQNPDSFDYIVGIGVKK